MDTNLNTFVFQIQHLHVQQPQNPLTLLYPSALMYRMIYSQVVSHYGTKLTGVLRH